MKRQLIAILWLVSLAFSTAWAAPTAQLFGGRTTVTLAPEFVDALVSLGVTPSDIYPGNLNLRKGKAKFPIPGGVIDLDSIKGDIYHNGGLGLGVPGTQVSLLNFIISTTDIEEPVLTGVAAVNGDVVDRIVLFNLDLSEATVKKSKRGILRVKNVGVTLSAVAADTLNTVFGVDAFVEDFLIGTADVITRARAIDHYDDDDDDDDEDEDD